MFKPLGASVPAVKMRRLSSRCLEDVEPTTRLSTDICM